MKISELLSTDAMILDLQATTKRAAIDEMVHKLYTSGCITDEDKFKEGILNREAQTSTGLGDGIAMPHAKNSAVKRPTVLFAKSTKGVDYEALDGQPVYLFFMIAAPEGANDTHLQALAALSGLLMDANFTAKLKEATTPDKVIALFDSANKDNQEEAKPTTVKDASHYLVAVTACPTGIAHTYMAEKALYQAAEELGVNIKVETNGSDGIKHKLTPEEIQKADAVIVAADKKVEMARFDGKKLLNRPVSDGVRKADELIKEAISGNAPIYHANSNENQETTEANEKTSIWQTIYKHLMNGVSNMLPFIIGGGIMIALAFLIDQTMGVPKDQLSHLGSYHEAAKLFKEIGDMAFSFMLPVLAGFIAQSIADRPGLVAGFVAGALANVGGAGFLGALVCGFVAGYIMIGLKHLLKSLPQALAGLRTILLYPLLGVMLTGFATLLINIPLKAVNTGLNTFLDSLNGTSAVLLGALLAGMMAFDLGGPVNKAAYVFATGSLTAYALAHHGSIVMAATMAGGMVPPLAIFFATLFFKNKFSKEDRDAGLSNIIMGLSFVTEGAIPFAAQDPFRAIPSFVLGSAITGGLVGLSAIKLMAPHGGIFVVMLSTNPLLYLLYVLIGALISGFVYGLVKPKK